MYFKRVTICARQGNRRSSDNSSERGIKNRFQKLYKHCPREENV
jgi:hypothetical protein